MEKINPIVLKAQQHAGDELKLRGEMLKVIREFVANGFTLCDTESFSNFHFPALSVNIDNEIHWCFPKSVTIDGDDGTGSLIIDLTEEDGGQELSLPLEEELFTVSELYSIYDALEKHKAYVTFSGLEVRRARAVACAISLLFERHIAPELEDMAITAGQMFSLLEKYTLFNDKTINPDIIWEKINKVNSEGVKRLAEVAGVKDRDIVEVLGATVLLLKEKGEMKNLDSLDSGRLFDYLMGDRSQTDAMYEVCVYNLLNAYVA